MGRYKRFLYTAENIPRSTAYRRQQRAACQRVSLKDRNSHNSNQNTSFATTSTSQNYVERTDIVSQDNFMSINRIPDDSCASYSSQNNSIRIHEDITNTTDSTESDIPSNSNKRLTEIASDLSSENSDSISSSERDLRSTSEVYVLRRRFLDQ
ncbi:uncharacterized protein LOC109503949 isoform X2 [Harpegnathos saltator]|uniref:uncharacterized protein LOC109503949 isoform X2 n=1 Tax=Harpegnathos saltator TaxID=610380 RepID=UPI000948FDBA|nr:uncharacterized protein LOC109503949 isoform X2 [Harpegnathos saltator]